jgi:hypothetical protein
VSLKVESMLSWLRSMVPVLAIAVSVAVGGTLTGFAWDKVHRATADDPAVTGTPAVAGPAPNTQTLKLSNWGVVATLPLAPELPLLSYAMLPGGNAVGLSSADLMKLGADCQPGGNALGTLVRHPAGAYGTSVKAMTGANVIATVGSYDYVYQFPQNACANQPAAMTTINREAPIVLEGLGSLVATP